MKTKILLNHIKILLKNIIIGPQYEWLARFSKNINNLEIGLENGRAINNRTVKCYKGEWRY
jgi:hypothetical protein